MIISELMLFFACFWSLLNFRVISSGFSMFLSFPLFSSFAFGIPFSNLLILLFSSLPIQAAQIFLKMGFLIPTIEGLGQSLACGFLFINLQCKELLYSFFSLSDSMVGCIFYFTTGLHGFHVLFGCFGFFLILCLGVYSGIANWIVIVSSSKVESSTYINLFNWMANSNDQWSSKGSDWRTSYPYFTMEVSLSLFLCTYYWHFVDWIWFLVFIVVLL